MNRIFLIKLSIGIALLITLLLWDENWRIVVDIARDARLSWIAPFIGMSVLLLWISCLKWGLFLREQSLSITQPRLFSLYLMGYFFNNFFPSSVGGDAIRSYMLGQHIDSQGRAMASVFLERLTGFIAMVTLAGGLFALSPALRREPLVLAAILIMGGACLGLLLIIWKPALVGWMAKPLRRVRFMKRWREKAIRFRGYLLHFKDKPVLIGGAMLLSYLFYVSGAVDVYLGAKLLGVDLDFLQVLVVTPIVMLMAALPLTPNGIGVWEWGFSVFLVFAGATPQEGLAIALALRSKTLVSSLIGGLLFALQRPGYAVAGNTPGTTRKG